MFDCLKIAQRAFSYFVKLAEVAHPKLPWEVVIPFFKFSFWYKSIFSGPALEGRGLDEKALRYISNFGDVASLRSSCLTSHKVVNL